MHHEHKDLIFKVTVAIDDCEGIVFPYSLAKTMFQVRKGLIDYLERVIAEEKEGEDEAEEREAVIKTTIADIKEGEDVHYQIT